jgi:hypothetical protein
MTPALEYRGEIYSSIRKTCDIDGVTMPMSRLANLAQRAVFNTTKLFGGRMAGVLRMTARSSRALRFACGTASLTIAAAIEFRATGINPRWGLFGYAEFNERFPCTTV